MKLSANQALIQEVARLEALRASVKAATAEMDLLKASLMGALGDENSMVVGEFLVLVSERTRTDLDKKALAALLGEEIRQYEKSTTYDILEIKRA